MSGSTHAFIERRNNLEIEERFFDCVSRRFAQKVKERDTSLRMTGHGGLVCLTSNATRRATADLLRREQWMRNC